jgi:hypothetical protein
MAHQDTNTSAILVQALSSNPFEVAAYHGAPQALGDEARQFAGVIEVEHSDTEAYTHVVSLRSIPGIAEYLPFFTLSRINSVSVSAAPIGSANMNLGFRIVPLEWANANPDVTPAEASRMAHVSTLYWRSNVTQTAVSDLTLRWPLEPVAASLHVVGFGLATPALLIIVRPAFGSIGIPKNSRLEVRVEIECMVQGRGFTGLAQHRA